MLLKIVLLAYSRGIISSRKIEAACREKVLFIAASGDTQPNFTTLAAFVFELGDLTAKLFAINGVKLPSSAGKAQSGSLHAVT